MTNNFLTCSKLVGKHLKISHQCNTKSDCCYIVVINIETESSGTNFKNPKKILGQTLKSQVKKEI